MNRKEIIKIENLYKSFPIGKRINTVLKNINLEIYKGELVTIFGPSGCGKSTLLNTVMGIERPDSGSIKILGINLWSMNADDIADMRKRNIGVVYQQQNWIKSLTVIENISLCAQLLGFNKEESLEKAEEMITIVGLTEYKNQYTTELSAGEQQKAGLARALILNPQVIIADEPTGNLDTKSGYNVLEILKKLASNGTTVVLVTHNPEYLEYSDRVVVMKDGKVIDTVENKNGIREDVEEVIKNYKTDETKIYEPQKRINTTPAELDYPEISLLKQITIYANLFFRFFHESTLLLFALLFSKIAGNKKDHEPLKISKKSKRKEKISKEIQSIELTELALKNLFFKKFRTIVTILGVSVGTGFVLLLLSLGYGFEKLVVDQISTAQNLNQVDAYPKVGSLLVLNDELIEKIQSVTGVDTIYKIKNFAGRLNHKGSTADVVVYGVENQYLENGPSRKVSGEYLTQESEDNEMLVNTEYLNLFGFDREEIIGQQLEMDIVKAEPSEEESIQPVKVTVVGVIEDDYPPVAYLKMTSVSQYTDENYSQATILVNKETSMDNVRKQIESLGLETFSVMDTINQVETMFGYVRYGLLFFGIVAFSISFLGMINTLVVSFLERTREVGLMKIVGMKKNEIMTIFISESMLIGFLGGILGILVGILSGYIVSLIIYLFSATKGVDFILLSHIPSYVILLVVICTTLLGFVTGLYPANRAVKIPPLDAIRYE